MDNDQDGVISEVQFKDLLRMMNVMQDEDEIEQLLAQVDPFNNKRMTYSEVVLVLSSHMVPKDPLNPLPNQQIALLEKFIQEQELLAGDGNEDDNLRMGEGQPSDVGNAMTHDLSGRAMNNMMAADGVGGPEPSQFPPGVDDTEDLAGEEDSRIA